MMNFSKIAPFAATLLLPTTAFAQVTTGATDVTTDDVQKAVAPPTDEVVDATEFDIQGGALVTGGNSQSTALTGGMRFLLRRGRHEGNFHGATNYARSKPADTDSVETTTENFQGRIRYDYFFLRKLSGFIATQARRDRFQGIDLRMGVDPGLSYWFFRREHLNLWLEGGYDFQYQIATEDAVQTSITEGDEIDRYQVVNNLRFFFGYEQKLDDRLTLRTGLEAYKALTDNDVRINFEAELRMQLVSALSLAIGSKTMYNNVPLPGSEPLDVFNSATFVYTFLNEDEDRVP